jgi:hypothetical protein
MATDQTCNLVYRTDKDMARKKKNSRQSWQTKRHQKIGVTQDDWQHDSWA